MGYDDYPERDSYYDLPFPYVGPLGGAPTPESIVRPMLVGKQPQLPKAMRDQLDMLKKIMDDSMQQSGILPGKHPSNPNMKITSSSNISMQGSLGDLGYARRAYAAPVYAAPVYRTPSPVYRRRRPRAPHHYTQPVTVGNFRKSQSGMSQAAAIAAGGTPTCPPGTNLCSDAAGHLSCCGGQAGAGAIAPVRFVVNKSLNGSRHINLGAAASGVRVQPEGMMRKIMRLQGAINAWSSGYRPVKITGKLDVATMARVSDYRDAHGLPPLSPSEVLLNVEPLATAIYEEAAFGSK
jgi:hypothetical protein